MLSTSRSVPSASSKQKPFTTVAGSTKGSCYSRKNKLAFEIFENAFFFVSISERMEPVAESQF